ncbi:hypothetical protein RDABS01_019470 [Bienertia sinuspersici]
MFQFKQVLRGYRMPLPSRSGGADMHKMSWPWGFLFSFAPMLRRHLR